MYSVLLLAGDNAHSICSIFCTVIAFLGSDVIQISPMSKMDADISEGMEA